MRTLSISVLRAILHVGSVGPDWEAELGKCVTLEAHDRVASGMAIDYLDIAAKELGCPISEQY